MRTWFTADHHFGHASMIRPDRRRFSTIDEHDDALVDLWNAVVRPGDVVWHVGDFAYKSRRHPQEHFRRLNGTKHLVKGNHDGDAVTSREWASVQATAEVTVGGVRLFLAHYPHLEWPGYWKQVVHLFGHVHGNREGVARSCDVGVDAWGYRPVSIDEIMQRIGDRENA